MARPKTSTGSKKVSASKGSESALAALPARRTGGTTASNSFNYAPTRLTLPRWLLDVIDEECKHTGFKRRSDFLNALVRRRYGLLNLNRAPQLPKVRPPALEDQGEIEQYIWHMPLEIRDLLEKLGSSTGGLPMKTWAVLLLCDWLQIPFPPTPAPKT